MFLRCSALILSVNHLVLLTKKTGTVTHFLDWVDQSLADVEDHLQVTSSNFLGVCITKIPNLRMAKLGTNLFVTHKMAAFSSVQTDTIYIIFQHEFEIRI